MVVRERQEKYFKRRDEGWLLIELATPHPRSTDPAEYSEIELRAHGRKVLEIRWNGAGLFKALTYEPGDDWEWELLDWPDPVPFD